MPAEFDDVLTNQPVVIDNVFYFSSGDELKLINYHERRRALGQSKQVSLAKIIQNVSSRLCASRRLGPIPAPKTHLLTFHPASVGRPKHIRVMAGALEGDVFIGRRAQEFRGLLKIKYPMEHGIVTDWDDMERIWSWVYAEELGTLSEEVRNILSVPFGKHPHIIWSLASRSTDRGTPQSSK